MGDDLEEGFVFEPLSDSDFAIFTAEKWSGRRGSNPALNVCASYGVCTNINICYELQPFASARLLGLSTISVHSPTICFRLPNPILSFHVNHLKEHNHFGFTLM